MAALGGSVSRRYARALFSIGVDQDAFEAIGDELTALAKVFESNAELRQALQNPIFRIDEKEAVLTKLLDKLSLRTEIRRFALLLLSRGRLGMLEAIARDYQRLADEKMGQVRGSITSAAELDKDTFAMVRRALEKHTGKKVIAEASVDPSLLGGIVAKVGDLVIDGSLKSRLTSLSRELVS
jgi:F-type H+-transporting ATPase subunit delta